MKDSRGGRSNWKQLTLGLATLLIFLTVVGFFIWAIWGTIVTQSPEIATAIIAAISTILISTMSFILSKRWERQREIDQEHLKQRIPIYEEFMGFWFRSMLYKQLGKQQMSDKEMATFLSKYSQKLIIWGSDKVVKEYSIFRRLAITYAQSSKDNALKGMIAFEKMLYTIRLDLGHKNKELNTGDLLALFVNDIDQLFKKEEQFP